jgi:hypothetical protein
MPLAAFSLRSYVKALQFRLQDKLGKSSCTWEELVVSDLERHAGVSPTGDARPTEMS